MATHALSKNILWPSAIDADRARYLRWKFLKSVGGEMSALCVRLRLLPKALDYRGRAEETFLLSAANAFEALSEAKVPDRRRLI